MIGVENDTLVNLVSRRSFCLHQSRPASGLTDGCVTLRSGNQGWKLSASLSFYRCVTTGLEFRVHSACSMFLRSIFKVFLRTKRSFEFLQRSLKMQQELAWRPPSKYTKTLRPYRHSDEMIALSQNIFCGQQDRTFKKTWYCSCV